MDKMEYDDFLTIIRRKILKGISDIAITPATKLKDDLMIDSLIFYTILIDIEKRFEITFPVTTQSAEVFNTVGSLAKYIEYLKEIKIENEK